MASGVIYIAFGEKYVKQAVHSAESVKKHSPDLEIAIICDENVTDKIFDHVIVKEVSHKRAKVDYISESPFEYSLYLDSDTEVVMDISDIFSLLKKYDLAMAHCFTRKRERWAKKIEEYDNIPYAFSEFNGGVVLFKRSPNSSKFFELWKEKFYKYKDITKGWDQASLRMAAWETKAAIHTLPPEFNVRSAAVRKRSDKMRVKGEEPGVLLPRIFHWHGLEKKKSWLRWFSAKYRPYKY